MFSVPQSQKPQQNPGYWATAATDLRPSAFRLSTTNRAKDLMRIINDSHIMKNVGPCLDSPRLFAGKIEIRQWFLRLGFCVCFLKEPLRRQVCQTVTYASNLRRSWRPLQTCKGKCDQGIYVSLLRFRRVPLPSLAGTSLGFFNSLARLSCRRGCSEQ